MSDDFYCEEVLSGKTPVDVLIETPSVLAFAHTRPFWEVHYVVIPKKHVASFLTIGETDAELLLELLKVVREVAARVVRKQGAARILTNLGDYQESKHLHFHVNSGKQITPDKSRAVID